MGRNKRHLCCLNEFPPAPESLTPDIEGFRDFQKQVGLATSAIKDGKNLGTDKLAPHLLQHRDYTLHYRNLKFLVKLGVEVDTIHSVVPLQQKPWLNPT